MITLSGHIIVPEEDLDRVREALPIHIVATRAEAGCLRFEVRENERDPGRFEVYEQFKDKESFEHHQERVRTSDWGSISKNVDRHYTVSGLTGVSTEAASELLASVEESRVWLLELDEKTVRHQPAPDRWSIIEVIGHLIDSACNNHQRFIRAQEEDKLVFPKYEQNTWASKNHYQRSDWAELVELWSLYNRHLAQVIEHIPDSQLGTPCTITPFATCTLEFIVTDYVTHLNHHIQRIRERLV